MVKFVETESTVVISRGWGKREWGVIIAGTVFHSGESEKVLKIDGGDGGTTR